jgi:hypothetical protein
MGRPSLTSAASVAAGPLVAPPSSVPAALPHKHRKYLLAVLRIRIRQDPKLLTGSDPDQKLTFRIRIRNILKEKFDQNFDFCN